MIIELTREDTEFVCKDFGLCVEGLKSYFDIPDTAQTIWIKTYKKPGENRLELRRNTNICIWFEQDTNDSPWGGAVDYFLDTNFPSQVTFIGVKYA